MSRELLEIYEIEISPFRKLGVGEIISKPVEDTAGATTFTKIKEVFRPNPNDPQVEYEVFQDGNLRYILRGTPDIPQNRFYVVDPKSGNTGAELSTARDPFKFFINPQNITVTKNKLVTEIRTRKGYEIQHWGPQISEISWAGTVPLMTKGVSGKPAVSALTAGKQSQAFATGYSETIPDSKNLVDITETEGYQFFQDLQSLYDKDQSFEVTGERSTLTALRFRRNIYVGYLRGFTWTEVADRPRIISYTIVFRVQEIAENLNEAVLKVNEEVFRNLETIRFLESDFSKI